MGGMLQCEQVGEGFLSRAAAHLFFWAQAGANLRAVGRIEDLAAVIRG